ncbi:MAG: hypothetical protein ACYT04_47035 [Nostoc sp.]
MPALIMQVKCGTAYHVRAIKHNSRNLTGKREMILVAAADQKGYAYAADDLNTDCKFT